MKKDKTIIDILDNCIFETEFSSTFHKEKFSGKYQINLSLADWEELKNLVERDVVGIDTSGINTFMGVRINKLSNNKLSSTISYSFFEGDITLKHASESNFYDIRTGQNITKLFFVKLK